MRVCVFIDHEKIKITRSTKNFFFFCYYYDDDEPMTDYAILYGKQFYRPQRRPFQPTLKRHHAHWTMNGDDNDAQRGLCYTCGYAHARHYCPLSMCRMCGEFGHCESTHFKHYRRRTKSAEIQSHPRVRAPLPFFHFNDHDHDHSNDHDHDHDYTFYSTKRGQALPHGPQPNHKSVSFLFAEGDLLADLFSK